ncbi:hypothetical protein [Microbacterium sp. JAI119]|uniref:hypothetical protein n=1 Tax=Microbacterium sp. JAI119 TaxID=2723062 RepID=UPI0015C6FE79|nr:hypothetical protein [Microbacterium sp. JAI119]NYF28098.1 hypothetical protein [Microbacterium sp. JAI119]
MKIRSGSASFLKSRTYGRFIQRLLDDPDYWIRRRIDDVSSPSSTELVRRISFDIHLSRVILLAQRCGILISSQVLLPLLVLPREIIAGVDIFGPDGRSLHLLKRSENSFLAEAAAKSTMSWWSALRAGSYAEYYQSTVVAGAKPPPAPEGESGVRIGDSDYIFAVALPLDRGMVSAALRGEDRLSLVKVSLRSTSTSSDPLAARWKGPGIVPRASFDYPLDAHPAGPSHQVRVDIPEGLEVVSAEFRTRAGERRYADAEARGSIKFTAGQVVANARYERNELLREGKEDLARTLGRVVVECRLSGELVMPVIIALCFVVAVLVILDVLRNQVAGLDSSAKAAVVALLLFAPALIGLYAARPTAHFKVRFAVNLYRSVLALAALALVAVAFMLVMLPNESQAEEGELESAISTLGVVLESSIWSISALAALILGAWLATFIRWRPSL